jgi:hypothetical protein
VNRSPSTIVFRFGCDVPPDIDAIAPSAISSPASAAFKIEAAATPLVSCVWKWIGSPISSFNAFTSTDAACGLSSPAMSLMARMCAPIDSSSFASST